MSDTPNQLGSLSLMELFQIETEEQTRVLSDGLLTLEAAANDPANLERLMRASHSLKGAARIVDLPAGVQIAHAMEDVFVAAQKNLVAIHANGIDQLFAGIDFLSRLSRLTETEARGSAIQDEATALASRISAILSGNDLPSSQPRPAPPVQNIPPNTPQAREPAPTSPTPPHASPDPHPGLAAPPPSYAGVSGSGTKTDTKEGPSGSDLMLRISSDTMNTILGLASELKVSCRRMPAFHQEFLKLKHLQDDLYRTLSTHREQLEFGDQQTRRHNLQQQSVRLNQCRTMLTDILSRIDEYGRHTTGLTQRLHQTVLKSKMVPFDVGIHGLGRLVRDLGRELGKKIDFTLTGADTPVDRDILHKMETPIIHMIKNAVDHGIESTEERKKAGKDEAGRISLAVFHKSGKLHIRISDDGCGVNLDTIRRKILARKMVPDDMLDSMSESELLEFLFLPNFTTREVVNKVSGRGVGLDAVYTAIQEIRGTIRINTEANKGTTFAIKLPLTLSVVRSLLMDIGGEPYALPIVSVDHVLKIHRQEVRHVEGKPYITFNDRRIGLISARQIFSLPEKKAGDNGLLPVIVLGDQGQQYGLLVDALDGIRDLVVQQLDPRLGKVKDISAASVLNTGAPILLIDPDDIIRSMDRVIGSGHGATMKSVIGDASRPTQRRNRILVVDDSITVREVEREMLLARGYEVEVAVDGMEAWHVLRNTAFDLVITDVDMPRWDGIKLLETIRNDPSHRDLPVIIVSYKDREDDRQRGLDAGADYYLTKGSFRDEKLVQAVRDLVGDAIRSD